MITGKKNWILAGLILALGTAVFLNWQFAPKEDYIEPDDAASIYMDDNLGDAHFVDTTPKYPEEDLEVGAIQTGKSGEVFSSARTSRFATRTEALDTLKDIIDNASLDSAQKTAAVEQAATIAKRMEAEASIETLVKAKCFSDCVAVISDTQVNVIIPTGKDGVTPATIAIIKDIVIGQIEISPSSIKIIEAK